MSKNKKIALIAVSLWPFLYIPIFIGLMFFMVGTAKSHGPNPAIFAIIFPLHILTVFSSLAVMVIYIINVFKNTMVKEDQKIVWVLLLFFLNMLAMPIYWYLYIWRGPESYEQPVQELSPNYGFPEGATIKYCTACGNSNPLDYDFCIKCGRKFERFVSKQSAPISSDDPIGRIIPYKNSSALIGYYFGVFSVIPFFPIGVIGFILGLKGLKYSKQHPDAHGRTHAWVGVIAGGFFGLIYLLTTIFMIYVSIFKPDWM